MVFWKVKYLVKEGSLPGDHIYFFIFIFLASYIELLVVSAP